MSELSPLIIDLALILMCAGLTTLIFKRLKQPLVLGYIVAGFIASPHMPYTPSVQDTNDIKLWADIGVIFLLFALGLITRQETFTGNFLNALLLGQTLNLFDLLVIDLLWWRHTRRVRFTGTENKSKLYADPGKHISSFLRGIAMFLLVALINGCLLTLL